MCSILFFNNILCVCVCVYMPNKKLRRENKIYIRTRTNFLLNFTQIKFIWRLNRMHKHTDAQQQITLCVSTCKQQSAYLKTWSVPYSLSFYNFLLLSLSSHLSIFFFLSNSSHRDYMSTWTCTEYRKAYAFAKCKRKKKIFNISVLCVWYTLCM